MEVPMYLEELAESIKGDLIKDKSYDRYPVRFFSMNLSINSVKELMELRNTLNEVSENHVEIIDIQNYLPHENGWITADRFRDIIYNLDKDKSYIVVGFSEYARFLSRETFITILHSLLELENDGIHVKRRIYFPCFSLFSQIKGFIKENHRRKDVYNPLLVETDIEDLPRMYFVDGSLENIEFENEIQTSKEWFAIWRNNDVDVSKPIVCTSKTLFYFYGVASPDNVYSIKRISTYKDVFAFLYNVHNLVEFQPDPGTYMLRLIKLMHQYDGYSMKSIILKELNTQMLNQENIYVLWKNTDKFKRWLIQNYCLLFGNRDSYLYDVLSSIELLTVDELKERIFEYKENLDDISKLTERKTLIYSIQKADGDVSFTTRMIVYYDTILRNTIRKQTTISLDEIDLNKDYEFSDEQQEKISSGISKSLIPIITDSSNYERQIILWLYRLDLLRDNQLPMVYPAFSAYLSGNDLIAPSGDESDKFDLYFSEYRKCRSRKSYEANYENLITKWNSDEDGFYSWYTNVKLRYPETILKTSNFSGDVYVIDGLGAEFMGYLAALLKKAKLDIIHSEYAKVHLPSITSIAKEYYDNSFKWITDYDQDVIHGKTYYHVENMEKSLSCIQRIVDRIVAKSGENGFAIIADHGATVGHKLKKKDKKYNFKNSDHDGRCYLLKEGEAVSATSDYAVYSNPNGQNWIISLTGQSLYNSSKYEVHGGGTPEEVMVPVIIAKKSSSIAVAYKVKPEKLKVSGLDKIVSVKVRPLPKRVLLTAKDGTNCEMKYNEETKEWIAGLKRGIAQNIEVHIEDQTFSFRTIPSTKMGGNDGFDD